MIRRTDLSNRNSNPRAGFISPSFTLAGIGLSAAVAIILSSGTATVFQITTLILGVTALIATILRPDWGLLVVIFIIYTRFSDIAVKYHGVPNVAKSFILVLAIAMAARWVVYSNERPKGWARPAIAIAIYCLVGYISLFYAPNIDEAQSAAKELTKDAVMAVIVVMLIQHGWLFRRVVWILILSVIFLGTLTVYQASTGTFTNEYGGFAQSAVQNIVDSTNANRAGGPIGDANYYAQILLVIVPLALDRLWNERRRVLRFLAAWALVVSSFSILLTYSRGGFVVLVIMLISMVLVFRRTQSSNWLFALAIGILLLQLTPAKFTDRLKTLTQVLPSLTQGAVATDLSIRGRSSELIVAMQMFSDYPILGVGLGNYSVRYQEYSRRLGLDARSEAREAHNLYLEIAAETGLIGLIPFCWLLWMALSSVWSAGRSLASAGLTEYSNMATAYAFSFTGYLVAAMFIHAAYPRYFWALTGIALATSRLAEREIITKVKEKVSLFGK